MRTTRVVMVALAAALFGAAGVSASCSDFGEEGSPPTPDADRDSTTDDVVGPDGALVDGGLPDADATSPPTCPPPRGAKTDPSALLRSPLYVPPAGAASFPFGIATDRTHVTWVEQPDNGDANSGAYDGRALARILRKRKDGAGPVKVLAENLPATTSVVIDGTFAYYATSSANVPTIFQLRLSDDCNATACPPKVVLALGSGSRIDRLYRHAPGVLIALAENGQVFYVQVSPTPSFATPLKTGNYPGLTLTNDHLYASSELDRDSVYRAAVVPAPVVDPKYLVAPPEDGGNKGVSVLATDCTTLFMTRYIPTSSTTIYGHDLADDGSFSKLANVAGQIFDLAADESHLYIASPGGGLFWLGKAQGSSPTNIVEGNVFRVAVDAEGVYYGIHLGPDRGTIMMLVK